MQNTERRQRKFDRLNPSQLLKEIQELRDAQKASQELLTTIGEAWTRSGKSMEAPINDLKKKPRRASKAPKVDGKRSSETLLSQVSRPGSQRPDPVMTERSRSRAPA